VRASESSIMWEILSRAVATADKNVTQTFLRSENSGVLRGPAGEICCLSKDYVTSNMSIPPNFGVIDGGSY